jgi:hypothetical protein
MSGSKAARNQASIINRANCGGTAKKGGLAPSIGPYGSNLPLRGATQTQINNVCMGNFSNGSQVAYRRRYL